MKKLLFLLICISLYNCSIFGDDLVSTRYVTTWDKGGIINDSLTLLTISVYDEYESGGFITGGGGYTKTRECLLTLADIRFEKIYWQKKIENVSCNEYFFIDSLIYFFDYENMNNKTSSNYFIKQISIYKLEDLGQTIKPKFKKIGIEGKGWEYGRNIKISLWQNGLILVNSRYYDYDNSVNHYALIDTTAGVMKIVDTSGEYEWLNSCDATKWSSVGGLCLKSMQDTSGFMLLKAGVDTLSVVYNSSEFPIEVSTKIELGFYGNSIISNGWIYLLDDKGHVKETALNMRVNGRIGIFSDSAGNIVNYNKKILY